MKNASKKMVDKMLDDAFNKQGFSDQEKKEIRDALRDSMKEMDVEKVQNMDYDDVVNEVPPEFQDSFKKNMPPEEFEKLQKVLPIAAEALKEEDDAILFSIVPKAEMRFPSIYKPLSFNLEIPMAGFNRGEISEFYLGNVGLGLKHFTYLGSTIPIALVFGIDTYLPTGKEKASKVSNNNPLQATRFTYGMASIIPYVSTGIDLEFILVQAHLDYMMLNQTKEGTSSKAVRYGASVILSPLDLINLVAEAEGIKGLGDESKHLTSLNVAAGILFDLWILKAGLVVRTPVVKPEQSLLSEMDENTAVQGATVDPSNVNIMITTALAW